MEISRRALTLRSRCLFLNNKIRGDCKVSNRKQLKLNIKFTNEKVICAKSPEQCKGCKEECEQLDLFYYQFSAREIKECFKNSEKAR